MPSGSAASLPESREEPAHPVERALDEAERVAEHVEDERLDAAEDPALEDVLVELARLLEGADDERVEVGEQVVQLRPSSRRGEMGGV